MKNIHSPSETPRTGNKLFWLAALAVLLISFAVPGVSQEDDTDDSGEVLEKQFSDYRTLVEMPDKARQVLHEDMLDHLAVLNEINRYLAENNLRSAAEVAETGMGRSLLAKYQDEDIRPGRYMPKEMRKIGWELHHAATQFAKAARQGNLQETLRAYHRITSACVACHYSYRTR
ncbi:MAG: hypothetical protein ABFS45_25490 [Pseudomonadota bacterium]